MEAPKQSQDTRFSKELISPLLSAFPPPPPPLLPPAPQSSCPSTAFSAPCSTPLLDLFPIHMRKTTAPKENRKRSPRPTGAPTTALRVRVLAEHRTPGGGRGGVPGTPVCVRALAGKGTERRAPAVLTAKATAGRWSPEPPGARQEQSEGTWREKEVGLLTNPGDPRLPGRRRRRHAEGEKDMESSSPEGPVRVT